MFRYDRERLWYRVAETWIFLVQVALVLAVFGTVGGLVRQLALVSMLAFWLLVTLAVVMIISVFALETIQTSRYKE